jgi:calcineurin-like phosphoesterase family protein
MYLTSDQHYGHKNIIGYCDRPFKSVEEMDEALIERHNQNVGKDSTVLVVGDFSFHDFHTTKQIVQRLNGNLTLIKGNHDGHSESWYLKAGFVSVVNHMSLAVSLDPKKCIEIQHYPRYNTMFGAETLFHGHAHNYCKAKHYVTNNQVLLNVGVDCWNFAPVHLDILVETVRVIRQQFEEHGKTVWNVGEI